MCSSSRKSQDFLKNTPEDHDDYENVSDSLGDMLKVASYIEKKKEEAENVHTLITIQDSLDGKFKNIVMPGRKYIHEGLLTEVVKSSKRNKLKTETYYCYLFDDLFMVAKRKGLIAQMKKTAKRWSKSLGSKSSSLGQTNALLMLPTSKESGLRYDFVKQIPLSPATTTVNKVSPRELTGLEIDVQLCFQLNKTESDQCGPIFVAPTEREFDQWLQSFERCIASRSIRPTDNYIRLQRQSTPEVDEGKPDNVSKNTMRSFVLWRRSAGPGTYTPHSLPHAIMASSAPLIEKRGKKRDQTT